jgi:hypothetical protein
MDASRPQLTEDAHRTIEVTARGLIRKCNLTPADLGDIISELTLDLLEHLPLHDDRRSAFGTFARIVVAGKSKRILRDLLRHKRTDQRDTESLDAPAGCDEDGHEVVLGDTLDADETAIGLGYRRRSRHGEAILQLDVTAVLSRLPRDLQECCSCIMEGRSVSEMARERGISRAAFRDRVIAPIRQAFRDAGYGRSRHEPGEKSPDSRQLGFLR